MGECWDYVLKWMVEYEVNQVATSNESQKSYADKIFRSTIFEKVIPNTWKSFSSKSIRRVITSRRFYLTNSPSRYT